MILLVEFFRYLPYAYSCNKNLFKGLGIIMSASELHDAALTPERISL